MELLRATFNHLRRARRAALIPFIMGGDPSLRVTPELLLTLEDAGADCIEVGIPFSDPLADGPVIQAASARALSRGATPSGVLSAVASVRRRLRVPIVCLTYWNPVLQFGHDGRGESPEPFLSAAARSGISGLIVPDLPVEEGGLLHRSAIRAKVAPIFLAAPTSPPQRLRMIARASEGFIYYVSVTGTTGMRRSLPSALRHGVRQLRLLTTKPICVGFGIATPAQAGEVARIADGVIVGSALVRAISQAGGRMAALKAARALLTRFRRAMR
jgi:tryptophan synthase alpha chain